MPCGICQYWAGEFAHVGDHHPDCPRFKNVKRTVAARPVQVFDADGGAPNGMENEPGDSQRLGDRLALACPGCANWIAIRCTNPKEVSSWGILAGSLDDPTTLTLFPSIQLGCCGWHGHLKNGVYESC